MEQTQTKNRLEGLFETKKEGILSIYFTAGYPALDDTQGIILELEKAGADLIEIGMPYSDPLADGPTIQESSAKALKNGMKMDILFRQVTSARRKTQIPLVYMGYFNPLMQYGIEKFCANCKKAGIDGLIIPDLPIDVYEEEYKEIFDAAGLKFSFLISPQTPEERIRHIDKLSSAFVYMVADSSITGATKDIDAGQIAYFERVAGMGLQSPRLIGFGISNAASFKQACGYAQGAIIGSAFIKALGANLTPAKAIQKFVSEIKQP